MAFRDSWHRAMVLSGLVDDNPPPSPGYLLPPEPELAAPAAERALPSAWLPPESPVAAEPHVPAPATYAERIVVRRMEPSGIASDPRSLAQPTPAAAPPRVTAPPGILGEPPPEASPPPERSVHRVAPRSFNDAQHLADRFKAGTPVILDLSEVETDLAKRLIGFASGLTYGLDGGMERLNDRVFLLIPRGVELPAAQRARLAAQGSLVRR